MGQTDAEQLDYRLSDQILITCSPTIMISSTFVSNAIFSEGKWILLI